MLRYDGTNVSPFVIAGSGGLDAPRHAVFGPDGNLYVSSYTHEVLRYDGSTGAFIDTFATTGLSGGSPEWLEFGTDGYLYTTVRTTSNCCETSIIRFDGATGDFVDRFDLRRDGWSFTLQTDPALGVVVYNSTNGHGNFVERFVSSTNPDPTKFYVVDDGSAANNTYEYGSGAGAPGESYPFVSGNTAPRGSAIAGFTTLVVDVNKNVYVYNPNGEFLGSWLAGGLNAQAQLEGVATHNVDVWLVDAKQDRVYRYADAAARLSGSQNAANSFNLNSANKNPKDIVTDGTYLWVVNDSTIDKVFKYTIGGALVGSWTISTPGATKPTGITLDRGNPNHLWIVDSGTDRVYQYDSAATRTGDSQSASTSFLLAAGNTNPQGIADPPVAADQALLALQAEATDMPTAVQSRSDASHEVQGDQRLAADYVFGAWFSAGETAAPKRHRRATLMN